MAASEQEPTPETWYRDMQSDRSFCVTAIDHENDQIEIQHFDGDIEQIDLGEWFELDVELAQPPEDWSGPHDRFDREDLDGGESAARGINPVPPDENL